MQFDAAQEIGEPVLEQYLGHLGETHGIADIARE